MDETKTIALSIYHFLSIDDDFTHIRIEAVLGVAMLTQNITTYKPGQIINDGVSTIVNYGTYGQSNIGEAYLVMKTSLQLDNA